MAGDEGRVDTNGPSVDIEGSGGKAVVRRRRLLYGLTSTALTAILGLGLFNIYGVESVLVTAEGGGYRLSLRYGTISRPALATPFDIEITRAGGFDGPVRVAITADYLRLWDENGLNPDPAAATTMGEWLVWEFDPPEGETLTVNYDAHIEPAAQEGEDGRAAVLEGGVAVVEVAFSTRIWP